MATEPKKKRDLLSLDVVRENWSCDLLEVWRGVQVPSIRKFG